MFELGMLLGRHSSIHLVRGCGPISTDGWSSAISGVLQVANKCIPEITGLDTVQRIASVSGT